MRHIPILFASILMASAAALGPVTITPGPAMAQDSTGDALATDPDVKDSQQPEPSPQGVRSPSEETSEETATHPLRDALAKLRAAPPDLQGNPVPRPNQYGSEPGQGGERTRSDDPSALSRDDQGNLPH